MNNAKTIAIPTKRLDCEELEKKLKEFNFHNCGKPLEETMGNIRYWINDGYPTIFLTCGDDVNPVLPSSRNEYQLSSPGEGYIGRIMVVNEIKKEDIDALNE